MMRGGLLARFLLVNSTARPQPWATYARELPGDTAGQYERAAFCLLNNYRNRGAGECEPIFLTIWQGKRVLLSANKERVFYTFSFQIPPLGKML